MAASGFPSLDGTYGATEIGSNVALFLFSIQDFSLLKALSLTVTLRVLFRLLELGQSICASHVIFFPNRVRILSGNPVILLLALVLSLFSLVVGLISEAQLWTSTAAVATLEVKMRRVRLLGLRRPRFSTF
ncbi:hypothetical protein C8R45DRAFT_940689 [Mycena sanguinolenta]|nr:hypothetical protein C8R45DRAFT_940689 [Mycena sanguinolenta]